MLYAVAAQGACHVKDAAWWIRELGLVEHPEGGCFRETYRSGERLGTGGLPRRFSHPRSCSTAIYYLLQGNQHSALHRIRSDEVWHFYAGTGLTLFILDEAGGMTEARLGPDPEKGDSFQVVVPAGCWFGAEVNDPAGYALVGCTTAPGFEIEDLEFADGAALIARHPRHRAIIERLARG
jgi:uncharacterized protein